MQAILFKSIIAAVLVAASAFAEEKPSPSFDAASVKLSSESCVSTTMNGGPGTSSPGRIVFTCLNMPTLLGWAFDINYASQKTPGWVADLRVDITATMPGNTSRAEYRGMLQNLLRERFHLETHRETHPVDGYALRVSKSGPKLTPAVAGATPELQPGIEHRCPGNLGTLQISCTTRGTPATMEELARRVSGGCQCPVVDETGLPGAYTFTLIWLPSLLNQDRPLYSERPGIPELNPFRALEKQLGLILERKKLPQEMVAVDHIDSTPVEN